MPATPTYGLRYPALADAPNGPQGFQNLAEDVEARIVNVNAGLSTLNTRVDTHDAQFVTHDGYGRGVVGRNRRTTTIATLSSGAIIRVLSVIAPVTSGRTYRVWVQGEHDCGVAPATTQPELRFTTNNTEPTTTSTVLSRTVIDHRVAAVPDLMHLDVLYPSVFTGTLRVALCTQRVIGSGGVAVIASATSPCELVIEDVGLTVATSGTVY